MHRAGDQPHVGIADFEQPKPELVAPMRAVFDKFKRIE